jgi:hypothetical protein
LNIHENKKFFEPESHAEHFTSSDFLIAQWDVAKKMEVEEKLRCNLMSEALMAGKSHYRQLRSLPSSLIWPKLLLHAAASNSSHNLLQLEVRTVLNYKLIARAGFAFRSPPPSDINKFRFPLSTCFLSSYLN